LLPGKRILQSSEKKKHILILSILNKLLLSIEATSAHHDYFRYLPLENLQIKTLLYSIKYLPIGGFSVTFCSHSLRKRRFQKSYFFYTPQKKEFSGAINLSFQSGNALVIDRIYEEIQI